MKKALFTLALISIWLSASSQVSLFGGYSLGFTTDETWPRFGFTTGGAAKIKISESIFFEQYAIYSQKGASMDKTYMYNNGFHGKSFQINSLDLPSFIGFKAADGVTLSAGAGISAYLMIRNKYQKGSDFIYDPIRNTTGIDIPIYLKARFDFELLGKSWYLEPIYIHGTQNIYRGQDIKTRTLSVSIGYIIK